MNAIDYDYYERRGKVYIALKVDSSVNTERVVIGYDGILNSWLNPYGHNDNYDFLYDSTRPIGTFAKEASGGIPQLLIISNINTKMKRLCLMSDLFLEDLNCKDYTISCDNGGYFQLLINKMKKCRFTDPHLLNENHDCTKIIKKTKYIDLQDGYCPTIIGLLSLYASSSNAYICYIGHILRQVFIELTEKHYNINCPAPKSNNIVYKTLKSIPLMSIIRKKIENIYHDKNYIKKSQSIFESEVDMLVRQITSYTIIDANRHTNVHNSLFAGAEIGYNPQDRYDPTYASQLEAWKKIGEWRIAESPLSALLTYEGMLSKNNISLSQYSNDFGVSSNTNENDNPIYTDSFINIPLNELNPQDNQSEEAYKQEAYKIYHAFYQFMYYHRRTLEKENPKNSSRITENYYNFLTQAKQLKETIGTEISINEYTELLKNIQKKFDPKCSRKQKKQSNSI